MNFRRYTLVALGWTLLVILWGAYVRASGSGAGCGDHWPNCNGELVPRSPSVQTVIEFTHRTTSGLALVSVVVLFIWARRATPAGHPVRRMAAWSLVLMLSEAAFGALLVKAELVANNATASRAVAMSIHLINTFLLVAALTFTTFHAHHTQLVPRWASRAPAFVFSLLAAALLMLVGVSGSVAALGDTLVQQSVHHPFVEVLIGLRIIHPLLAIGGVAAAATSGVMAWSRVPQRQWIIALWGLLVVQVLAGLTNVVLQAPTFMQLIHLGLADLVWIVLLVINRTLVTTALEGEASQRSSLAHHPSIP